MSAISCPVDGTARAAVHDDVNISVDGIASASVHESSDRLKPSSLGKDDLAASAYVEITAEIQCAKLDSDCVAGQENLRDYF